MHMQNEKHDNKTLRSLSCTTASDRLALVLLTEADSWRALRDVKDDVLALQEDVSEDGEANVLVCLDTTEAGHSAVINRGEVDVAAGNCNGLANVLTIASISQTYLFVSRLR